MRTEIVGESDLNVLAAAWAARSEDGDREGQDGNTPPPESTATRWPSPLLPAAFHGVVGSLVRAIEPESEADPAAILIQLLVGLGSVFGRNAYYQIEGDQHYSNLFAVIVGPTAIGRKGTSFGQVRRILEKVDGKWAKERIVSGLSSGEGLIWAVRDPIEKRGEVVDDGVSDKRLLVVEPEFARVLETSERHGNTLSPVVRCAWDSGNLNTLTKDNAARATSAHISILGHITAAELRRKLSDTAVANGLANRFLWVLAKRSKLKPDGGDFDALDIEPFVEAITAAMKFAETGRKLSRDDLARTAWYKVYEKLSGGRPGMLGAVTSRAAPQVVRLSCVYALLDCSPEVRIEHLKAALAVWQYTEASAEYIFGTALGDATADEILRLLKCGTAPVNRTDISNHFGNHKRAAEITRALGVLEEAGLARRGEEETAGRKAELWSAT